MQYKVSALKSSVVVLALTIAGCSFFPTKSDHASGSAPFQASASPTSDSVALPAEIAADITKIAAGGQVEEEQWKPTEPTAEKPADDATKIDAEPIVDAKPEAKADDTHTAPAPSSAKHKRTAGPHSGKDVTYTVKSGDTLMKIAFEKYGNIYRWREIYDANKEHIPNYNALVAGTVLNIQGFEYVVIERNGKPYLIRRNDTLVKISRGLYGTPKKWKSLWDNNRQLIHDPNKIYAGFTLYYVPTTPTEAPVEVPLAEQPVKATKPAAPVAVAPPPPPSQAVPTTLPMKKTPNRVPAAK